ncbi:hypothetical protein F783_012790 [Bordetella holmesii F627]|nr:hypothetical protein F783_012790 [Bordetella holmesii F627]
MYIHRVDFRATAGSAGADSAKERPAAVASCAAGA